jgi:SSS family transporter
MDEAWVPGTTTLSGADYAVLAVLTAALFGIGVWASRGERTTGDFFLAKRSIPWWAVCLSFVATEISAMTVVGVPATAYRENWQYAQFFIGSAASRLVIAYLFIPAFYKYDCTTIYEFLRHRFGPGTQYTASVFFFVTRLLASGVRLMAACVAVKVLLGWPLMPVIALFTLVSVVYIGFGGIKAVIWTNVLQALTFLAAGVATLFFLYNGIEGGLGAVLDVAGPAGRLDLWNWGPALSDPDRLSKFFKDPNIVWIAVLNGFFMSMAAFGTDQELMQRLLTVETRAASQRSMIYTIGASLVTLVVFISVGTGLYVWYAQHPSAPLPAKLDEIYPHFAVSQMPALLRGLVLSAIVMASIDSPLASLTSSFVTDIYRPLIKADGDEAHYMRLSRACVLVFGLILGGLAYGFSFFDKMLWLAFKVGGVTFGSLLGVFLYGLLTERHADRANTAAMVAMAAVNFGLLLAMEYKYIALGWSWLIILGTFGTFALTWLLAPALDGARKPA